MQSEWHSSNFSQPTSPAPSELMMLAEQLGLEDDELRELLRAEIQRRRRARGDAWATLESHRG